MLWLWKGRCSLQRSCCAAPWRAEAANQSRAGGGRVTGIVAPIYFHRCSRLRNEDMSLRTTAPALQKYFHQWVWGTGCRQDRSRPGLPRSRRVPSGRCRRIRQPPRPALDTTASSHVKLPAARNPCRLVFVLDDVCSLTVPNASNTYTHHA